MSKNSPNTQPIFIRSPKNWSITLQTELGSTNPSSTLVPKTLAVGGDPASAIEAIQVQTTGDMVASILYLYLWDTIGTQSQNRLIIASGLNAISGGGLTQYQIGGLPPTLSPASPAPATPNRILRLPEGWELRAALSVAIANPIIVTAYGGDYA